ncbi:MAG TPA: ankyrin repeat domain-containing protein [Puia sp.]|nr:ankyrin repeat domain-containing protein [Puia sp.]
MTDLEELISAAKAGDTQRAAALLDRDLQLLRKKDNQGATALHYAALNGQRAAAELLIQRGADVNSRDDVYDATPAGWAIEYLRKRGALLGIELRDFAEAVRLGDTRWVARWIQRFPDLRNARDEHGTPFRQLAAATGFREIIQLFAEENP